MSQLPCISLKQPWAWAIVHGTKRVENRRTRTWNRNGHPYPPTRHRGLIGIHASGRVDRQALRDPRIVRELRRLGHTTPPPMPTGRIIAVAVIVDCHLGDGCCGWWADWGVWHLALDEVRALPEPIRTPGTLGLPWYASEAVTAAVVGQVGMGVER